MINKLALKTDSANPNHHLWNNHGTWWLHCTLHLADYTKRRVRRSLGTREVGLARERRDAALAHLALHVERGGRLEQWTCIERRAA
jgi:hypothetical protein